MEYDLVNRCAFIISFPVIVDQLHTNHKLTPRRITRNDEHHFNSCMHNCIQNCRSFSHRFFQTGCKNQVFYKLLHIWAVNLYTVKHANQNRENCIIWSSLVLNGPKVLCTLYTETDLKIRTLSWSGQNVRGSTCFWDRCATYLSVQ